MTLDEAKKTLRDDFDGMNDDGLFQPEYFSDWSDETAKAIAVILNDAIGMGCPAVPNSREPVLSRFSMRNGHNEQQPHEDREAYNLRVYGLREEDME